MGWEQLTLPESLPEGYLPASNPDLVEGYISIKEILSTPSTDFGYCWCGGGPWCDHHLNSKREDPSYSILLKHFKSGGKINVPILRYVDLYGYGKDEQSNGHHRIIAAMDAGFTHVPYQTQKKGQGWRDDWSGTPDYDDLRLSDSE